MESLTDATTGATTSTYRYTAYGSADKRGTTGEDAITGDLVLDADMVNPYRFGGKRFEGATGSYDMGFRDYNPGLSRFLSRDMYNGALDDLALGSDPWNTNRYAFAGGNPVSRVDLDGHWGISLSGLADAVSDAGDGLASTAVGGFVVEHKAAIAGFVTGVVVMAGCTATAGVATAGAGAVACAALAGAAGNAVTNALDEGADHSVGGYAKTMAGGAALGVVTLGAGKALAPVVSKLAAPLKTAAGNAAGKLASRARTAVSGLKSGCSSFAGVTTVLMADGSQKAIEDIQPGDKVLATDPETGEQAGKEVTQVWVHDDTLVDLAVDGEVITTTEDHPFFNLTDGLFQRADEIEPGEQVLTDAGRAVTVKGLNPSSAYTALAYNLTVAGIHTYHVGNQHILVHNTKACDPTAAKAGGEVAEASAAITRYVRPGHATTTAQRASVQGRPCVDCGKITDRQVADHIEPLVKEHYRTGSIDLIWMRSVDAVQRQCSFCSNSQVGTLSWWSRTMRSELGIE